MKKQRIALPGRRTAKSGHPDSQRGPASLQSELAALIHHREALNNVLEALEIRQTGLKSQLQTVAARVATLRALIDHAEPTHRTERAPAASPGARPARRAPVATSREARVNVWKY